MTPIVATLNALAGAWAKLAWAVAWQSTLLVGACALVALGLRRSSPSLRYWLWQIAAIKILVMPLWGVSIALPATPRHDTGASPASARSGGEVAARPTDRPRLRNRVEAGDGRPREAPPGGAWIAQVDRQAWLLMGWGLGLAVQVVAIVHQRHLLKRLLLRSAPADDPALIALVVELCGRVGLRRPPSVMIGDDVGSPFVCGLWRPVLVLPRGLSHALGPEGLRPVLLHELSHLERRDLLWDWIPASARLLHFFHPAVHYIVHRARLERELACDQAAMVLTGLAAGGYAMRLIEVVSRSSAPPASRTASAPARLDGAEPYPTPGGDLEVTPS